MDLTHRFTVPASLEETWKAFSHIDRVAPFFPGATITSVSGDEFAGVVKIKFGPLSLAYEGSGSYLSRDHKSHTMVLQAAAADRRGNGVGTVTVTATFAKGAGTSEVEVRTDLNLNGRPAQFGRSVVSDVSDRLADQFAAGIAEAFAAQGGKLPATEPSPATPIGVASGTAAASNGTARGRSASGPTAAATTTRLTPPSVVAQPDFDALATLVPVLVRQLGPALLAVAGLAIAIRLIRRATRKRSTS